MLNLVTTLSLGCFDVLNIPGKNRISLYADGTLVVSHVTSNESWINTMTYYFNTDDEIKSIIAYLKQLWKEPKITIFQGDTNTIQKIV